MYTVGNLRFLLFQILCAASEHIHQSPSLQVQDSLESRKCQCQFEVRVVNLNTGRIQCEVLTTLPFYFSWIKKFLGQQSKI